MVICTSAPLLRILLCNVVSHVEITESYGKNVVDELVRDAFCLHGRTHSSHLFVRTVLGTEDRWMHILWTKTHNEILMSMVRSSSSSGRKSSEDSSSCGYLNFALFDNVQIVFEDYQTECLHVPL